MLPQALSATLPALESSQSFSVADETKPSSCGQSFWFPRSVQPPSARIRAHSRLQSSLPPLNSLRRTSYARTSSFAFLGSATLAQNQALQARREKLLLRKTRALPGFACLLALGQNLSDFRTTRQAKGAGREQTEVIMSNFELQEKAVKTAARFIERKGFELLETGWTSLRGNPDRPDRQRRGRPGLHRRHRNRVRRGRLRGRQGQARRP